MVQKHSNAVQSSNVATRSLPDDWKWGWKFFNGVALATLIVFTSDLGELIQRARTIIDLFSKAKAAKLIRELVDLFLDMEATTGKEVC